MGSLLQSPAAPPASTANLITLQLHGTGSTQATISADTAGRNGCVGKGTAFSVVYPAAPVTVNFVTDCLTVGQVFTYTGPGQAKTLTVTQAMVNQWVAMGKPKCWCCLGQKAGNGAYNAAPGPDNGMVNTADLAALRASWNKTYPAAGYNACADFDLSGAVNTADLANLRAHWNMNVGACAVY